jgi:NAD(P)H-dependent FMN reductase
VSTSNLLGISGSLRAQSINTEVLHAVGLIAPPSVHIAVFRGLVELPHFNPDLDTEGAVAPAAVQALRAHVAAADGLFICSPEYAHGVPGALKNAMDWLVSSPEILFKPIGLLNASPRSVHAPAALAETLRTMSGMLVPGASVDLPLSGRRLNAAGIAADATLAQLLRAAVEALVSAIPNYRQVRASLAAGLRGRGRA